MSSQQPAAVRGPREGIPSGVQDAGEPGRWHFAIRNPQFFKLPPAHCLLPSAVCLLLPASPRPRVPASVAPAF